MQVSPGAEDSCFPCILGSPEVSARVKTSALCTRGHLKMIKYSICNHSGMLPICDRLVRRQRQFMLTKWIIYYDESNFVARCIWASAKSCVRQNRIKNFKRKEWSKMINFLITPPWWKTHFHLTAWILCSLWNTPPLGIICHNFIDEL